LPENKKTDPASDTSCPFKKSGNGQSSKKDYQCGITTLCCIISQKITDLMWFGNAGLGVARHGPVQSNPVWCFHSLLVASAGMSDLLLNAVSPIYMQGPLPLDNAT